MIWFPVLVVSVLLPAAMDEQCSIVEERLPNGVQIIASLRPDAPYSAVSLWVNRGSGSDPKGKEGTAHLLEHLLPLKPFNGTTVQIAMEQRGALLVPETGRDFMAFHLQAPHNAIAQVFPLLVEAVKGLEFNPKVLEREKKLMQLEILALYEDPLWLMKAVLESRLFDDTTYSHPPTGWLETIERLSFEDALQFHRRHFFASNLALIAVVPKETNLMELRRGMADMTLLPSAELSPASTSVTGFSPSLESMMKKALSCHNEALWGIGWRIPLSADEKIIMDALVQHLRQTLLSHLFGQLGVVKEWGMVANPIRGELALTIMVRLQPYTDLVERWTMRVLRKLAESGLTETQLTHLKRSLAWEYYRNLNDPLRCIRELGWAWAIYGEPRIVGQYGEKIVNLTSEQIRQLAMRLNSIRPVISVIRK